LTPDNKSLTTIKQESLYNIWVYSEGKQDSLKKITVEEGRDEGIAGISLAANGKVIYTVRTKEAFDLWSVNGDDSENRQLTFEEGSNYSPAISPDGKYIVFTSTRSGNSDLWRINIDGSDPVALTSTPDSEDLANFTPDGKWIVFTRANAKNWNTTWKLNLETQELVQLTEAESFKPKVSPDGKVFVCYYGEAIPGESEKLAIIPIEGGKPIKLLDLPLVAKSRFRWSSDGKSLIYVDKRDRIDNLWSQTLDSNPPKQLTFFDSGKIMNFTQSSDGKGIAFSRGSESSDVALFENFR
jgi:Tol biopolymer transport system component